jgi:FlaA1/EpsC-like NDP-sugar epimerase
MSTTTLPRFEKVPAECYSFFIRYRLVIIVWWQVVLICASYYLSFVLRLDSTLGPDTRAFFWNTLPLVIAVKLAVFYRFGLLRGWWRYVGMNDLLKIALAMALSSTLLFGIIEVGRPIPGYPRSVIPIDMLLSMLMIGGARFSVRAYAERERRYDGQKRTLIVGAGYAGTAILRELKLNPGLGCYPIGFVDDELGKLGITINGVEVLGDTDALTYLIARHHVECVLIAIPSASGLVIQRIVDKCRQCKVSFKILPTMSELLTRPASLTQMRKLRVEDLLSRSPVQIELEKIRSRLENQTLLITGAGGSVGSELARQVASFRPGRLVLFDRAENDLFKIGRELAHKFPELNFVPVVGDILDVNALRETFALHQPKSVFHAAAYKHVPMMESNCFQAVTNNIFGTYNVALVAKQYHTDDFVMISSDKAVKPTNIMGVTKRVAEIIILALQRNHTRFIAVRFGNVLGSNGSVLPIFEEQIANGGPVTVTHPDAQRYFMTIAEAVQLVLQASTMGNGGEIFILNMGEPVKIVDLARRTILLSGLEPEKDIKVVFTGLRPGEKLSEELRLEGEGIKPTSHEKIYVLDGGEPDFTQVRSWLESLSRLVERRNVHGIISELVSIVPEYVPSEEIIAQAQVDRHDQVFLYQHAWSQLPSDSASAA